MKIVKQIEKQIEVIKAFYHTDEETIFQESALYKSNRIHCLSNVKFKI